MTNKYLFDLTVLGIATVTLGLLLLILFVPYTFSWNGLHFDSNWLYNLQHMKIFTVNQLGSQSGQGGVIIK